MSDKAFAIAMANTIPKGPKGDKGDPGDVSSVNTKTGAVVLDAGDLEYDGTETYTSGTVGAEITNVKSHLDQVYIIYDGQNLTWESKTLVTYWGVAQTVSGYQSTDYIDISAFRGIELHFTGYKYKGDNSGITFYDSSKKYVEGCRANNYVVLPDGYSAYDIVIQIPESATYFRESIQGSTASRMKVYMTFADFAKQISLSHVLKNTNYGGNLGDGSGQTNTNQRPVLFENWPTYAKVAYDAVISKMRASGYNAIPIFIETDSHGCSDAPMAWVDKTDESIKCVHLGDYSTDKYVSREIAVHCGYLSALKNACALIGNHDVNYGTENMYNYDLVRYVPSTNRKLGGALNYYVVDDHDYRVRYIAFDPFSIDSGNVTSTCAFGKDQVQWLVDSLESSPYDVILLSHLPVCGTSDIVNRSGSSLTVSGPTPSDNSAVQSVITAFQSKTTVSVTVDGETISADFSTSSNKILCCLNGHLHAEGTKFEFGIRHYSAINSQYLTNQAATFVVVDRENSELAVFRFDATQNFTEWDLSLTEE